MLTKEKGYLWARPSLFAHKVRSMAHARESAQERQQTPVSAMSHHVKKLRDQEMQIAGGHRRVMTLRLGSRARQS